MNTFRSHVERTKSRYDFDGLAKSVCNTRRVHVASQFDPLLIKVIATVFDMDIEFAPRSVVNAVSGRSLTSRDRGRLQDRLQQVLSRLTPAMRPTFSGILTQKLVALTDTWSSTGAEAAYQEANEIQQWIKATPHPERFAA